MEVNGSDTAAGFNASLLYTPIRTNDGRPIVNFGLVYRSQVTLHLDGDFRANGALIANSQSTLVLPQVVTAGVAVWPVRTTEREWKLEFDVDYTGWKSIRNLDVRLSNGTTIQFPQNWSSTFTVMIGSEYTWLNPQILPHWDIALRGGYWFSESPMPDQTYNPTFPADADNHSLSLGLGLTCRGQGKFLGFIDCNSGTGHSFWPKSIGMDFAYQAILYEERTVTGATNPVAIPGVLNGTYDTTFHVGAINIRLGF
jgi:long-chain fatty acid transport protein